MNIVLSEKVKLLPQVPGVYMYKNINGRIIYVGKAKNLRNRVKSYFQGNLEVGSKTYQLVENIVDMEYIEALSELEALILEAALIKKHQPKYNIALKDDKSHIYIVIRSERLEMNGTKYLIPKILTERKTDLQKKDIAFGPYPDAQTTKYIVRTIRKVFPFRDCSISKFNRYHNLGSPCLYGHLGLCPAPCVSKDAIKEYKADILKVKRLLSGESIKILNTLRNKMTDASKKRLYEQAAEFRDILRKFEYVRQSFKTADKYIENPYLVEDLITKSLDELVKHVSVLNEFPSRIECYDISNISGKEGVGSMVAALDGRIVNSEYKRFRIKFKDKPDDFEMIREVLRRRFAREKSDSDNKWPRPDLVVIDGGKGQVSAALDVLEELNIEIAVIGLAKRFETIVYCERENSRVFKEVTLERTNEGLKLLQRLRDEAHRFAQKYHHQLRLRKLSE